MCMFACACECSTACRDALLHPPPCRHEYDQSVAAVYWLFLSRAVASLLLPGTWVVMVLNTLLTFAFFSLANKVRCVSVDYRYATPLCMRAHSAHNSLVHVHLPSRCR